MVEVKGYVRSGNTLFWQLPSGKYMRMPIGPKMQAYTNKLDYRDEQLKVIRQKYENQPKALKHNVLKGRCEEAASEVAKLFAKLDLPVEVHSFLVDGKNNHVIAYSNGVYYDYTGKQYNNDKLTFKISDIPKNYKFKGVLPLSFYIN